MKNQLFLNRLSHNLYAFFIIFTLVLALVGCKEQVAVVGEQAPEIAAFDLQGNKVELSQWKGKKVLLTFWSGNCGMCVKELELFEQRIASTPSADVQIIAINIDGENADVEKILAKQGIELFVVKDQLKISAERYQVIGTPTSFVIDHMGKILYKFEGVIPETDLLSIFQG